MHYESTLSDLVADQVGHDNDDDCVSDDDWKYKDKVKHEQDVKII